jgi:3-hydroxy-9,10-secoandrosta-1,3,5(10)-triene-9,17-dione monooxygenase
MATTRTQAIPVPEPGLTQEEVVQRARDMIPILRERQEECERIGRLPDETSRAFVEAGFYRILQPRRFGGYEFDLPTFTRVAIALARGCPASGWTFTLTAGHAHMLAALWSEEGQIDIYGADGEVRMPGRFRPGTATPVDGGYRVSGTWDYVSGCDSATHMAFGFNNTVQPELAADSFGRMHFGLPPHGFDANAGPPPPPVR